MIDATIGRHLWSEKYDRKMRDLFELQDEITKKIVTSLQVELTLGELARSFARSTDNIEAWSNTSKGFHLFLKSNKEDNAKARELFETALKLDPGYVAAWGLLAETHLEDSMSGWSESRAESFKRAVEFAQKALAIDEKSHGGHIVMGNIYLSQRQHEKAITEFERSIFLSPNSPDAHALLAGAMYYSGRFEEALELMKKAMRLGPYYPAFFLFTLGSVYSSVGRYEEAIAAFNQLRDRCRKGECPSMWWQLSLAGVYVKLGREEEARALVSETLETNPKLSLGVFKREPYKDPAHLQRVLETFRKAGLK